MTQRRSHSWLEACCSTATGFLIAMSFTWAWHLYFGTSKLEDFIYVFALTIVSIVRQYLWRRAFNAWRA